MVWGCFSYYGVETLVIVRGTVNSQTYCTILRNEMLRTLWSFYGMYLCYFQDDNGSCHVSEATMQWYADNNIHRLDWSAHSPALSPIEHLWDKLDRRVGPREMRPNVTVQLSEMLQEEWRRIPTEVLHKLVESLARYCKRWFHGFVKGNNSQTNILDKCPITF